MESNGFAKLFADFAAYALATVFVVAIFLGVSFGAWASYSYFKPKYVAVDNETFHQSQQYNDGMIRDLEELQLEYIKAPEEQKPALKAVILHRFSVYPTDKLPNNLRSFYEELSR